MFESSQHAVVGLPQISSVWLRVVTEELSLGRFIMSKFVPVLLVLAFLAVFQLSAQVNATGTLAGIVTDKSGAVVPGADVKIANKEIGLNRETKSNGSGQYRFDLLPAGSYEVRVTMPG